METMELTESEQQRLYYLSRTTSLILSDYVDRDILDINLCKYKLVKFNVKKGSRITHKGRKVVKRIDIVLRLDYALKRDNNLTWRSSQIYQLLKQLPTDQFPKYLTHEQEAVRFFAAVILAGRKDVDSQ